MEPVVTTIGTEELRFELAWKDQAPNKTAAERTAGILAAYIGPRQVWGKDGTGIDWAWIELLEHLSASWRFIEWEESDPLGLNDRPERLRSTAERRWELLPEKVRSAEERALWAFEQSHNLSAALHGIWVENIWLLRRGNDFLVSTGQVVVLEPARTVLRTLSDLGDHIAQRLLSLSDERATKALTSWRERRMTSKEQFVETVTGLPGQTIRQIVKGRKFDAVWRLGSDLESNEVLVAARMVGRVVEPSVTRELLDLIRSIPFKVTPALDQLTAKAESLDLAGAPHEDGQVLAEWLRNELGLGAGKIDVEYLLDQWKVLVKEVSLGVEQLDAVSCWGRLHGPAIILNKTGRHIQTPPGKNATLAHEICHLVIDRKRGLPLGDVVGGSAPRPLEARARSFAAEFLLPRRIAGQAFAESSNPEETLKALRKKFGVSKEVVAWQARNSTYEMPPKATAFLRKQVTDPSVFSP